MRITVIGLALLVLTGVVGITGLSVAHFWTALMLLGLGWNFAFIGATTLVTECHRPEERTKVQSFNDFLIFGSMAVASFSSGQMLAAFGWATINAVIFPTVLIAAALLIWHAMRRRARWRWSERAGLLLAWIRKTRIAFLRFGSAAWPLE